MTSQFHDFFLISFLADFLMFGPNCVVQVGMCARSSSQACMHVPASSYVSAHQASSLWSAVQVQNLIFRLDIKTKETTIEETRELLLKH